MVALYDAHAEDWRAFAACRNAPGGAATMHPTDAEGARVALSYCLGCVVRPECWAYAVEHHMTKWGTWGGRCVTPGGGVYEVGD